MLAHWKNSPLVDMLLHSDTLFWFQDNQYLLWILNTACLLEKQHIPLLVFGFTWLAQTHNLLHTNHYITSVVTWPEADSESTSIFSNFLILCA